MTDVVGTLKNIGERAAVRAIYGGQDIINIYHKISNGHLTELDDSDYNKFLYYVKTLEKEVVKHNHLDVYCVNNTNLDPHAINVFTYEVDKDGNSPYSLEEYINFYKAATSCLPDTVATCLLPSCMSAEVWTKEELIKWRDWVDELIQTVVVPQQTAT